MIEKLHAGGQRDSTTTPRNRSTSSPQEGTCSGDAVMCSGVATYASGCSRERSGHGSPCCGVQWYYDDIADCTRPKTRLEHNSSRGLVVSLPFVQMLHARTCAASRSHWEFQSKSNECYLRKHSHSQHHAPPQLAPTAVIPLSRMQDEIHDFNIKPQIYQK
jgi:hypothetical protein